MGIPCFPVVQIQSVLKDLPVPWFRWFILSLRTGKLAKGASDTVITSFDTTIKFIYVISDFSFYSFSGF